MARIKSAGGLPEWFDLQKYRGCESFNAAEWLSNLWDRKSILNMFAIFEEKNLPIAELMAEEDWLRELIQTTRAAPIQAYASFWHDSPVKPLRFAHLAEQIQTDRSDKELSALWKRTFKRASTNEQPLNDPVAHVGTFFGSGYALLADLRATDSVLIEAFTAWLKASRATRAVDAPSMRERPAYKEWAAFGLLPYLDLLIWTKETGANFTYNQMAQAVGYFRGGDSFRKNVPDRAAKLMNSLADLTFLAASEAGALGEPEAFEI